MGNPEILRSPSSPAPVLAPELTVLWVVYRLRDFGRPMAQEEVMRTGQLGMLEFFGKPGQEATVRLVHPSGYPSLANLYNAQLCPAKSGRVANGLLLKGVVTSTRGGVVSDLPQAWWCKVHSLTDA